MSLKFKLAKKIYESNSITIKDKLDFIQVIKEFTEKDVESFLIETLFEMPMQNVLASPAFKNRFKMIVQKLIKSRKSPEEAKSIANRMLGIKSL